MQATIFPVLITNYASVQTVITCFIFLFQSARIKAKDRPQYGFLWHFYEVLWHHWKGNTRHAPLTLTSWSCLGESLIACMVSPYEGRKYHHCRAVTSATYTIGLQAFISMYEHFATFHWPLIPSRIYLHWAKEPLGPEDCGHQAGCPSRSSTLQPPAPPSLYPLS